MSRTVVDRSGPDEVVWLDNGSLRAGIVPALGGRVLALRLGGHELLHRDPELLDDALHRTGADASLPPLDGTFASWRNWGGDKTWPAPQGWDGPGQWAGPPDPVLDGGPYEAAVDEEIGRVALVSGADSRTGLRVHRTLWLEPGGALLRLAIALENTSQRSVRWAPWNVTQVPGAEPRGAGDGVYVGVAGDDVRVLFAATGTPVTRAVAPGAVHVPAQDVVGKLGWPLAEGWLAHVGGGIALTQRWSVDSEAPYPDAGSRAEVWLEHPTDAPLPGLGGLWPRHRIAELEALGALADLAPGGRAELDVTMGACACSGPVVGVGEAGCVVRPLAARTLPDGTLRVEGEAGTFFPGEAELRWQTANGRDGVQPLGSCSPDTALRVAVDLPSAADTVTATLTVSGRPLDRVEVPA